MRGDDQRTLMSAPFFLFATGIENSNPTIHGGKTRVDEMEKCGHYTYWREDLALAQSIGASTLRWGPPGSAMTMDFREDRLTVSYDEQMVVTRLNCG